MSEAAEQVKRGKQGQEPRDKMEAQGESVSSLQEVPERREAGWRHINPHEVSHLHKQPRADQRLNA